MDLSYRVPNIHTIAHTLATAAYPGFLGITVIEKSTRKHSFARVDSVVFTSEDRHDDGREPPGIQQRSRIPLLVGEDRPARRRSRTGVFATDGSNPDTTTKVD